VSGLLRLINGVSEYLLCVEAIQVLNLGSLLLDPEDNRKLHMGAIWNHLKKQGSSNLVLGFFFLDPEDIREIDMGAI
jgi:hypothetical protein